MVCSPAARSGGYGPEDSGICVVRSIGYEIVTSVIFPSAAVTGVSFGMTKPVYDGRFSASTRLTTSSRSAESKWMP